jgi:hypothetical protein
MHTPLQKSSPTAHVATSTPTVSESGPISAVASEPTVVVASEPTVVAASEPPVVAESEPTVVVVASEPTVVAESEPTVVVVASEPPVVAESEPTVVVVASELTVVAASDSTVVVVASELTVVAASDSTVVAASKPRWFGAASKSRLGGPSTAESAAPTAGESMVDESALGATASVTVPSARPSPAANPSDADAASPRSPSSMSERPPPQPKVIETTMATNNPTRCAAFMTPLHCKATGNRATDLPRPKHAARTCKSRKGQSHRVGGACAVCEVSSGHYRRAGDACGRGAAPAACCEWLLAGFRPIRPQAVMHTGRPTTAAERQ